MKSLKKLNHKGFSHHLILPVLVIAAVTAIGVYLLNGSKAAELPAAGLPPHQAALLGDHDLNSPSRMHFFKLADDGGIKILGTFGNNLSNDYLGSPSKDFSKVIVPSDTKGAVVVSMLSTATTPLKLNSGPNKSLLSPLYSPDGKHIAYDLQHIQDSYADIYTANADGTGMVRVKAGSVVAGVTNSYGVVGWQPVSGNKLAYLETRGSNEAQGTYSIVDKDGKNDIGLGSASSSCTLNVWSLDGSRFAFYDRDKTVHVVSSTGAPIGRPLSLHVLDYNQLCSPYATIAFSPKGDYLAYYNPNSNAVEKVNIASGAISKVYKLKINSAADYIIWFNNGNLAFVYNKYGSTYNNQVVMVPAKGAPFTAYSADAQNPVLGGQPFINFPVL